MPKDVPMANRVECENYGAHVTLVDGLISDCARMVAERKEKEGWFDVSTLKEPFRVEGKKTMGYEVAEQLGWRLPQGIIYPTGGGVGLIGMWKAFDEMEQLGWIGSERPKMVSVQSAGCAPIVKAWDEGKSLLGNLGECCHFGCRTSRSQSLWRLSDFGYSGKAVALRWRVYRRGNHGCVAALGPSRGIFAAPEGAASLAAYRKLRSSRILQCQSDTVVLFNTGSGLKYLDTLDTKRVQPTGLPTSRQIAGIIGPVLRQALFKGKSLSRRDYQRSARTNP